MRLACELFDKELCPALAEQGIRICDWGTLQEGARAHLGRVFEREIFPVLTPIALDPAHPFPFVASGSLNLAALLETNDPEEPDRLGVVQVPRVLPRILRVPARGAAHCYVELFPRLTALGGFELGTGTYVEIVDPALAAQELKSAGGA